MDDTQQTPAVSADEIITSLFAAAERTRLPHEPAHDEPSALRRFAAWLDAYNNAVGRGITPIGRAQGRPGRIQRRPAPSGPSWYPLFEVAAGNDSTIRTVLAEVAMLPIAEYASARPSVQRLILGTLLRQLREGRGITADLAADAIRSSRSKISRMEHGRVSFKERDVADLLVLYGVASDQERAAMLTLARDADTPGLWYSYSDVLARWLRPYAALESAASVIRTYHIQHVPALLQTESYARALIQQDSDATEEELAWRIVEQADRQALLTHRYPPQLWAVIDESALRRLVGTRDVTREQLRFLIEITDHPAVNIQILPFTAAASPSASGPFTIFLFDEPDLPEVVYVKELTSAIYLDRPADVESYVQVMGQLCLHAEPVASTKDVISAILADT
jgi:transcriptional regulator with XRE-family HTH domain